MYLARWSSFLLTEVRNCETPQKKTNCQFGSRLACHLNFIGAHDVHVIGDARRSLARTEEKTVGRWDFFELETEREEIIVCSAACCSFAACETLFHIWLC